MRLAGAVSAGSGTCNEDAAGVVVKDGAVVAAWVFDGVTGINSSHILPAATDARWLVEKADAHLHELAATDRPLPDLLAELVARLEKDWAEAAARVTVPPAYDPPAACLLLAKRYADGWHVLRLGDSVLLAEDTNVRVIPPPQSDLGGLEAFLRDEARRRRAQGQSDFKALLREFHPRLMASRRSRNTAANHSILVADKSALNCPEYIALGWPASLLLCTDGFYRAVDTYGFASDAALVARAREAEGVNAILQQIRAVEADDPACETHLRFKPADDASAVMLVNT